MSSPKEEIFIKKSRRFQYSLEFSKLHWKYRCKAHHNALPAELRQPYFNYNLCHCIVLRAVVDAILEFVSVDLGAHGIQSNGGVFRNSAVYRSLESQSLQLPENTVLPLSETALPHVSVGDEAYRLTAYITKRAAEQQTEGKQYLITDCRVHGELQKVIWNLCFGVEDCGQSH